MLDARHGPGQNLIVVQAAKKILYLVTEDWYFMSHRVSLARAARDAGYDVVVGTSIGEFGAILQDEGFEVLPVKFSRSMRRPWRDLSALLTIISYLRREKIELVHLVSLKPMLLGGAAANRLAGCVIGSFTGLGYLFTQQRSSWLRAVVIFLLRRIFRGAHAWAVVQNVDDQHELRTLGIGTQARNVLIAGSGVDTDVFQPPAARTGARVKVVLPARLLRDKGVVEFVAAARILAERQLPVECVLVGAIDPDNPAAIKLETLNAWQAEGHVRWDGYCRDMVAVYHSADLVCLPSYREGLPKALLEAAACGCALVATDVPGCRDICVHGETGLLVPPADATALASAIEQLVADSELRKRFGGKARELVCQQFAAEHIEAETLALYDTAISQSTPAGADN